MRGALGVQLVERLTQGQLHRGQWPGLDLQAVRMQVDQPGNQIGVPQVHPPCARRPAADDVLDHAVLHQHGPSGQLATL